MEGTNDEQAVVGHIRRWLGEAKAVPADAKVQVREELHCADPACPLRRTVLEWTDAAGGRRRAVIVKPLVYVRRADVERAVRRGPLPG
ncbi:MAG: hypothetical protein ABSH19_08825 [Opitutales bacterium]|jgi:hypothetical protein